VKYEQLFNYSTKVTYYTEQKNLLITFKTTPVFVREFANIPRMGRTCKFCEIKEMIEDG
jgi:hypothetical protein